MANRLMGLQLCPSKVAEMKLAWLFWEIDWTEDGDPEGDGHWVFKEERDDWRHGKWKRIVYCEVEE